MASITTVIFLKMVKEQQTLRTQGCKEGSFYLQPPLRRIAAIAINTGLETNLIDLVYSGFFPSKQLDRVAPFFTSLSYSFQIFTQYGTYSTDMSDIANGYLETILDWIPGMENIRLRDFPSFIQSRDIDDTMLNYMIRKAAAIPRGSNIMLNTFDALEHGSVNVLTVTNPRTFTIGPLDMMQQHFCDERLKQLGSNRWKEI
ncbi:hypothetical protein Tco_1009478 [Tanacetum coccineum]